MFRSHPHYSFRNLPVIEMAQTIGRVIRLDKQDAADIRDGKIIPGKLEFYCKRTGYVTVPVLPTTVSKLSSDCNASLILFSPKVLLLLNHDGTTS